MAWDDAPPKPAELKSASAGWDSAPPSKNELAQSADLRMSPDIKAPPQAGILERLKTNWDSAFAPHPELEAQAQAKLKEEMDDASGGAGVVHGATLGYEPQIIAGVRSGINALSGDENAPSYVQMRDDVIRKRDALKEKHPADFFAGSIVGGAIPSLATGGGAGATSLMGAVKTGAATGAAYGALSNPGDEEGKVDMSGQLGDRLVNAALGAPLGAAMGAGFYGAGKGLASVGDAIKTKPKENAAEIQAAAKALGFEPTPGMVTEGTYAGGAESSLSQSPSIGGALMRREIDPVRRGLGGAAEKSVEDASFGLQPFESGEIAKNQMLSQTGERLNPLQMSYDEIENSTKEAMLSGKGAKDVGRNITNLRENQLFENSPWAAKSKMYADALEKAQTVDDLSKIRTLVRQDSKDATGPERQVLSDIYEKITDLRQRALLRAAKEAGPNAREGESIGRDLVGQLKETDQGYKSLMGDLQGFSENARLGGVNTPRDFTEAVTGIKSEDMANKLFNLKDQRLVQDFQQKFPEAYETLRQAKLAQLAKMSKGPDGNISPSKFAQNIDSLSLTPEMRMALFKGNAEMPGNISKVVKSLPPKVGPSGTPQGESFKQDWNPMFQAKELARYGVYKTATSGGGNNLAEQLMQSPRFAEMARKSPQAFQMLLNSIGGRVNQNQTPSQPQPSDGGPMQLGSSQQMPENPAASQKRFLEGN